MATHTAMTQGNDPDVRGLIERNVGILHFVYPKEHAWNGVTRKRYVSNHSPSLALHDTKERVI